MNKLRVYVGCSLAKSSDSFKKEVADLKLALADSFEVLEFLGQSVGNNSDVYKHDMSCVEQADFVIAVSDEPSTGLGIELERARILKKPTLVVAHSEAHVSRLVLGMAENEPTIHFERYNKLVVDVPAFATTFVSRMVQ